jgi:hypothetical protein
MGFNGAAVGRPRKPDRPSVRFIHTPQTKDDIEAKIVPAARREGVDVDAGRYDPFELPDGTSRWPCLFSSILAHGFDRVSEKVFDSLWTAALSLADVDEASLPCFPTLGDTARHSPRFHEP